MPGRGNVSAGRSLTKPSQLVVKTYDIYPLIINAAPAVACLLLFGGDIGQSANQHFLVELRYRGTQWQLCIWRAAMSPIRPH